MSTQKGYFPNFAKLEKLHKKYFQEAVSDYHFTPNEVVVLIFLYNNAPTLDTASDIARYKGISKGQVAASVDALCKKGYLVTRRDEKDRRVVHLAFSQGSEKLLQRLKQAQVRFTDQMSAGIPPQDLEILEKVLAMMRQNIEQLLEGDSKDE